jgi:hypothetical protein
MQELQISNVAQGRSFQNRATSGLILANFFFIRAFFCRDVVAGLTNGYKAANW